MSTTTSGPAVRTAFDALIDYAGLFPPAALAMDRALAEFAAAREGPAGWMLGRFIVPAGKAAEAAARWRAHGNAGALPVTAIAGSAGDARGWFDALRAALGIVSELRARPNGVRVGAIEIPLAAPASARETLAAPIAQLGALLDHVRMRDLPAYVELPPGMASAGSLTEAMRALARARLSAKIRCGGVDAQAVPPVADVAAFVAAAARERVAFKATAGLHHPVRHVDAAGGTTMHGFLNVLAAAAFAGRTGEQPPAAIVAEEDPRAFRFDDASFWWRGERAGVGDLQAVRERAFVGFGSCSFEEPVADLVALGLLATTA